MLASWLFLAFPNTVMIIVYLAENLHILAKGSPLSNGPLCQFFSFCAICTVISSNGSSVTVAYLTNILAETRKVPPVKFAILGNISSWISGLIIASILLAQDSFGPYQNLYCCVKEESYKKSSAGLVFAVFSVSISFQLLFYGRSYKSMMKGSEYLPTQSTARTSTSVAVLKRAIGMVSIFYFSWFLVFLDAALLYAGYKPYVWVSIVAAWMAKLEPLWYCAYLRQTLRRIQKNNAAIVPAARGTFSAGHMSNIANDRKLITIATQVLQGHRKSAHDCPKR